MSEMEAEDNSIEASSAQDITLKTDSSPAKDEEVFSLQTGEKVRGEQGHLLTLIRGSTPDSFPTTDRLTRAIYPGDKKRTANKKFRDLVHETRKTLYGTDLEIIRVVNPQDQTDKGRIDGYYLRTPEQAAKLSVEVEARSDEQLETNIQAVAEPSKSATEPEFSTLSGIDVTMIAESMRTHYSTLSSIAEQRGVKLIEDSILEELVKLKGDEPVANFANVSRDERKRLVSSYRARALGKVRELIASADFDETMEAIFEKNPRVWYLIANIFEMVGVKAEEGSGVEEGITFLEDILVNPEGRERADKGLPEAVVLFDSKARELPDKGGPVKDETVEAGVRERVGKPKGLEIRDPDVRVRVNRFLDQIEEHPELLGIASPGMVTRAFSRLKTSWIDGYVEAGYVPTRQGNNPRQVRYGALGIATMLYLYDYADNLPSQLKKQAQDVVAEEVKKREELKKRQERK